MVFFLSWFRCDKIFLFKRFNHSSVSHTSCLRNEDSFFLNAERNIPKNSQIFSTYGELSNAELLQTYGFVEENNPHDYVMLPRKYVVESAQAFAELTDSETQQRLDFLKNVDLLYDHFI